MAKCPVFYQAATEGVPVGGIIMWSGAASAIPAGWALCDGANGTSDLRGRFVLGAGGTYGVGARGGEERHTLTVAEMPGHTHTIRAKADSLGSIITYDSVKGSVRGDFTGAGTTDPTGSSQPHNNMPPYYALCYIMKL